MSLEFGFNSYRRYKAGTKTFASWLVEAGKTCGETIDDIVNVPSAAARYSQRSKSKKNKNNPRNVAEQSSYTIRVQHFVKLAEAISASTSPKVVVPTSVMTLLSEVISLRKEVFELLGGTITRDDGELEGHTYFIGVLEQVKELLQPLVPGKSAKNQTEPSPKEDALRNVFEALTLEEPSETEESVPATSTALVVPESTQQKYDIESDHNEIIMSSLFFFRDLKHIRDYLTGLWARYVIDEMDLVTVAVVTNTAIELLRQTIQELMSTISGRHGAPGEQGWIRWVYSHICPSFNMNHPDNREYPISSATTLQADFTCLPALIIVERFMRNFDPGQPSIKPPSNPYEKTTPRTHKEQFGKDEIYLHRYMADLSNAPLLGLDAEFPPSMDDITKAFVFERVAFKNKGVPAWLAIALQIQLDIQRLFYYESSKAFEDLQRTAESTTESVSHYFRYSRALVGREETFHNDNDPEVLKVVQFISAWLKQDPYNRLIKIRSKGSIDPATKPLLLSPFFFLRENPLFCGLMSYFLKMGRHVFAIGLSNTYDAIISAAHLYNAARQMDLRRGPEPLKWPDMEYILATHSVNRLFIGSFPKEPVDFFKRYQLAIGVSPTNFARNKRSDKYLKPKKISSRRLHEKSPIHEIFEPRYLTLEQKCDFSDATIDPIIKELITGSLERGNEMDNIKSIADQWLNTRKLTTLQLLQVVQIAMKKEDMHLNYDYFSMHIRCHTLLINLRQKFITDSAPTFALVERTTGNATLPHQLAQNYLNPGFAMPILLTRSIFLADPTTAAAQKTLDPNAEDSSEFLQMAGVSLAGAVELMRPIIEEEGNLECIKAALFCKPVDHAYLASLTGGPVGDPLSALLPTSF